MRAILRRENWWSIIETRFNLVAFPVTLGTHTFIEAQLESTKANIISALILSINDNLVETITAQIDPALAWATLKTMYQFGNQSQILTLISQLQVIRLSKKGSMEDYIKKTLELQNHLISMGESIFNKIMIQIILKGLP